MTLLRVIDLAQAAKTTETGKSNCRDPAKIIVAHQGPAYFILTSDGRTLLVAFQDLSRYKSRGFPWTEFEIIEAPRSGIFFAIKKVGEKLKPSHTRPPFSWEEHKRLGFNTYYQLLDLEFSKLKEQTIVDALGPSLIPPGNTGRQ